MQRFTVDYTLYYKTKTEINRITFNVVECGFSFCHSLPSLCPLPINRPLMTHIVFYACWIQNIRNKIIICNNNNIEFCLFLAAYPVFIQCNHTHLNKSIHINFHMRYRERPYFHFELICSGDSGNFCQNKIKSTQT